MSSLVGAVSVDPGVGPGRAPAARRGSRLVGVPGRRPRARQDSSRLRPVPVARPSRPPLPCRPPGPARLRRGPRAARWLRPPAAAGDVRPAGARPHHLRDLPAPALRPVRLTIRGRRVLVVSGLLVAVALLVVGRLATGWSAGTPVGRSVAAGVSGGGVSGGGLSDSRVPGSAVAGSGAVRPVTAGSVLAEQVAAGAEPAPAGWTVVTAAPGDTIWAVAEAAVPGVDIRETVARIVARNGLVSSDLGAGDALLVPVTPTAPTGDAGKPVRQLSAAAGSGVR